MPIAWYYEWLILVIIGAIAFGIAYGKTRTLEFEQFITSSKLFHEFDEMVFRKLVEKVVICEDSVVFKFTDYLEREVPLID